MEKFVKELEIGEIHQRDKWQFELKSEYCPLPDRRYNDYTQEFYFFIPNALQVNEQTYSKENFYRDLTNFIRYKTPEFKLKELCDETNNSSPLTRLNSLLKCDRSASIDAKVKDELKLLGNIVRSSIRERIRILIDIMDHPKQSTKEVNLYVETRKLCYDINLFREKYLLVQSEYLKTWTSDSDKAHFLYNDEFISNSINYYLTGLVEHVRRSSQANKEEIDKEICDLITQENLHRKTLLKEPDIQEEDTASTEYILYRSGLLNKYVLDALLLETKRASVGKRFRNLIGSIAAGVAMFFFFYLFVKQGTVFLINSTPFILITVFLYILKDRLKEGLKTLSYRQFSKWFADYKTDIFSTDQKCHVGKMREYVSFVEEQKVPAEITRIRNREFHAVLETFKRPEQVMYYQKKITLFQTKRQADPRRKDLNIILRFNISQFLQKADNPKHQYVTWDPHTQKLQKFNLPKVYHLNIILKNTFFGDGGDKKTEFKKFRLILDKNGIKRVEYLEPSMFGSTHQMSL